MERKSRSERFFSNLRWVGLHPVLWTLVGVFVLWRIYSGLSPHIERVDLDTDGRLVVSGQGFGGAKGLSSLVFGGEQNQIPMEVVEWRAHRVVAVLETPTSGSVTLTRNFWYLELADTAAVSVPVRDLPSQPYGYSVPVQPAAPWPLFRRDHRNTGQSRLPAQYNGAVPWSFQTRNAVGSTPVLDQNGTVYFGSGDGVFYAVGADGKEIWRYATRGIIDSAAALMRPAPGGEPPSVIVPSGDGGLYRLSTELEGPRSLWAFLAPALPLARFDNAFEGNVAIGHDGTVYAGNTNLSYYALTAGGEPKWTYRTDNSARSMAAIDGSGTVLWGGIDGFVHAVKADGSSKWTKGTLGMVAASVAAGSDDSAYVGSFDSHLYALEASTGNVRWTFKTNDHIVATAALGEGERGNTTGIYVGSTDGRLYALNPKGHLLWKYNTGDPVRSSAAVGLGPKGETPGVVYFGSGNGKLYALDAADGRRRWSFDTTPSDPELRERNDLNSSVALGWNGIYVGSQSGALWYVPYDYCLHADDPRCNTEPGEDLAGDQVGLAYVSPGGTTYLSDPPRISPSSVITLRLISHHAGGSIDAHFCHTALLCSVDDIHVDTEPSFSFGIEPSSDGQYLHIVPTEILRPDTPYRIRVEADYYTGGFHIGNLTLGGSAAGTVMQKLTLRTQPSAGPFPLTLGEDQVAAVELARIAVPIPSTLTSLHQVGFDASSWILSVIHKSPPNGNQQGRLVVWGIGARRDASGALVPDPDTRRTLALKGRYERDSFTLQASDFVWTAGGISAPIEHFEIRGLLGADRRVRPGASLFAKAAASANPSFSSQQVLGGLTRVIDDKVFLSGTYLTRPYEPAATAGKQKQGLRVSLVERARPLDGMPGKVVAELTQHEGARYKVDEHRIALVLIDKIKDELVPINYVDNLYVVANADREALQVILSVPDDIELSHDIEIVVLVDAFPVHRAALGWAFEAK